MKKQKPWKMRRNHENDASVVKREAKRGIWLEEVPVPQIGINDVLIRVDRTGIAGRTFTSISGMPGHRRRFQYRWSLGTISWVKSWRSEATSATFTSGTWFREGHVVCGRSRNCLAGRRHLCKDTLGVGVNRRGLRRVRRITDEQRMLQSTRDRSRRRIDLRSSRKRVHTAH